MATSPLAVTLLHFRSIRLVTLVVAGGLPWMPMHGRHAHLYFTGGKTEAWGASLKAPQTFCEAGTGSGCSPRYPRRHLQPSQRSGAVRGTLAVGDT